MPTVPRQSLADRFSSLPLAQAKALAGYMLQGDPGGPVPCWGAIAARFERDFPEDSQRLALLPALIEEGDARALLLFVYSSRARPAVLAVLAAELARLPPAVQRALASLDEAREQVQAALDALSPAVRQVFEAGEEARRREREQFEARVAQLLAFRFFVPDTVDPAREDQRAARKRGR
jgi:hypothetical protein